MTDLSNEIQRHRLSGIKRVQFIRYPKAQYTCSRCGLPIKNVTHVEFKDGVETVLGPECIDKFMAGAHSIAKILRKLEGQIADGKAIIPLFDLAPEDMPGWGVPPGRWPPNDRQAVYYLRAQQGGKKDQWVYGADGFVWIPKLDQAKMDQYPVENAAWTGAAGAKWEAEQTAKLSKHRQHWVNQVARLEAQYAKLIWTNWSRGPVTAEKK